MNYKPKVSCLLVTADRRNLLKRSLHCYRNQTYENTELVVVDNGHDRIDDLLANFNSDEINYNRIDPSPENVLGDLRNISIDQATGDYLTCWDDDDWYHPERIALQMEFLNQGNYDACCLTTSLVHLNSERFKSHPYKGTLKHGVPPSILHQKDDRIRYPSLDRKEDTYYLKQWRKKRFALMSSKFSHLLIRCYHGSNTWDQEHFIRRIRNSPKKLLQYIWHAKVKKNLFAHPNFRLTEKQEAAFQMFMDQSHELDLLDVEEEKLVTF